MSLILKHPRGVIRPEVLRAARQLELRPQRRLSAPFSGAHTSPHRGSGMQFKEFRPYTPGDDVRHISWSVTARTGKATLKVFEEDREINTVLLVDGSGSSLVGNSATGKIEMYADLLGLIGLASQYCGNPFGTVFFDENLDGYYRPQKSRAQLMHIIAEWRLRTLEGKKTELAASLVRLAQVLHSPSLIFILSDFRTPDFSAELFRLAKRHEIVLLHAFDDEERHPAGTGVWEIADPEGQGYFLLDTGSAALRQKIEREFRAHAERIETLASKIGARYLPLSLNDDYLQRMVHYFSTR